MALLLAETLPYTADDLTDRILQAGFISGTPVSGGAALPDLRLPDADSPHLVLTRLAHPVVVRSPDDMPDDFEPERPVCALLFLVSPTDSAGQHLRVLSELVTRVDEESFLEQWTEAFSEALPKPLSGRSANGNAASYTAALDRGDALSDLTESVAQHKATWRAARAC